MTLKNLAAVFVGLAVACLTNDSQACSPGARGIYLTSSTETVPLDGVWSAAAECYLCAVTPNTVELLVTDASGNEIAGEVTAHLSTPGGYLYFLPAVPLTLGQTYKVTVLGEDASSDQDELTFVAGAARGDLAAAGSPAVSVRDSWSFTGEEFCCEESFTSCGGVCDVIPESGTRHINVTLDFSFPLQNLNQFLYRTVIADGDDQQELAWSRESAAHATFSDEERSVCFEIFALHMASGEESLYYEGCVDLGDAPVSLEADVKASLLKDGLGTCEDPGDFEDTWCEIFSEPLRTGKCDGFRKDACEAALVRCPQSAVSEEEGKPNNAPTCSYFLWRSERGAPLSSLLLLVGAVAFIRRRLATLGPLASR